MNLDAQLDKVLYRYDELNALLAEGDGASFARLSRELSELEPVAAAARALMKARADMADAEAMMADPDMKDLAAEEYYALKESLPGFEREVQLMLLPKDEADEKNAILEVRAGTGGEEAALFAAELFRMYERYAGLKGWRFEVMDFNDTGIGGMKEASATITGRGVFARLKFESGVHRVQRVPVTESGGRIHTSAATVAVLPEAEEVDSPPWTTKDLRFRRLSQPGIGGAVGQHHRFRRSRHPHSHRPCGGLPAGKKPAQEQGHRLEAAAGPSL